MRRIRILRKKIDEKVGMIEGDDEMGKKKKLTIWICEDDESSWAIQEEDLKDCFPGCFVKHFENAGFACQATGSPDFIIVDVGGMCSLGCDIVSLTRYNIEGLAEKHPGAIFIVFSAMGDYAKDVYDEVKPEIRAITCWMDGCDFNKLAGDAIKKWL